MAHEENDAFLSYSIDRKIFDSYKLRHRHLETNRIGGAVVDTKELRVEIVSVHTASVPLCASASVLLKALTADAAFSYAGGQLSYQGKLRCEYSSTDWFNADDRIGILHAFRYSSQTDITQEDCNAFAGMLKAFRANLYTLQASKIETLWDDVSFRYCRLAYPIILNTENQMRRLIAQFMLKTLGARWIELSAPKEVRDQIGKGKRGNDAADPLHEVDFDTLIDYLTHPYTSDTLESMYKYIRSLSATATEEAMPKIEVLKAMIPQSNWSRYFSKIVECEDTKLRKLWGDLYELRCKVAHNTYLSAKEFGDVLKLSEEIDTIVSAASAKLAQVTVSDADAVELETMATQLSEDSAPLSAHASPLSNEVREHDAYRVMSGTLRAQVRNNCERAQTALRRTALAANGSVPPGASIPELAKILYQISIIELNDLRFIIKAYDAVKIGSGEVPTKRAIEMALELDRFAAKLRGRTAYNLARRKHRDTAIGYDSKSAGNDDTQDSSKTAS